MENHKNKMQLLAILSLSMANSLVGTGISPALETIRAYFSEAPQLLVQMIVSLPSLMVIVVSFFFSMLSRKLSMRTLCLMGYSFFTVGGLLGGVCSSIYAMVITRVIIGIGYGIMMPLSIGMLAYFYDSDEQQQLNGKVVIWSSVSSILCMIAAGYLAGISWRWVFWVYLFGIPCMILCRKYIPNVTVASEGNQISLSVIRKTGLYAIGTFVIFVSYFAILNNFSGIALNEGTVSEASVGFVMPIMTVSSLATGQYAEWFKRKLERFTMPAVWVLAVAGFLSLLVRNSLIFSIIGLIFFGMALALAVSTLNAEAGMVCSKDEALSVGTVIMFMRSFGQFISPVLFTGVSRALTISERKFPYMGSAALCTAMLFVFWRAAGMRKER